MKGETVSSGFRFTREEISGSLGDLGTFLPLTLGYITQAGLSPAPVFFFAGLWNVVTGIVITSYSIHYTKLYEPVCRPPPSSSLQDCGTL